MNFKDIIGQEEAKRRLLQMVEENRLPHAIILCGPAGCGKFALALAFASHLLRGNKEDSENANIESMLNKFQHPDLHFTYPTIKLPSMTSGYKPTSDDFSKEWQQLLSKGPYFSLSQWLEQIGDADKQAIITAGESDSLIHKLNIKSSQGGYKVSIIWLPERMNIECANKMLKLIEEPPTQTLFIMVSEDPDKLLATIRSRTQRIDIKRIDNPTITQALITERGLEPDTAQRIARIANGNWLKALEALDNDNDNALFLEMFKSLMRLAYQRKIKDLSKWSETISSWGRERQKQFLEYFLRLIRENFIYNFQKAELCYMTQEEEAFSRNFARFVNEKNILSIYDMTNLAIRDISQNANSKIVFFDFSLRMIMLLLQK